MTLHLWARRAVVRRAAVLATVPLVVLLASCASGVSTRDDGDQPGQGLTVLQTVGLFVLIPLGLFLLIALLVYGPSMTRGSRYRPGLTWWAEPVWFGGPADAEAALAVADPTTEGGGTSARW